MTSLTPIALIGFLLAWTGGRIWVTRSLRVLTVEQKALALNASWQSGIWFPLSLTVFMGFLFWGPTPPIPPRYALGLLSTYAIVPFLLFSAINLGVVMHLSRRSLPSSYLRSVRVCAIICGAALLFLVYAVIHDLVAYAQRRVQGHETSNTAMELTTSDRTTWV